MSFAQDSGYTPTDFESIISFIREGINTQFGTAYTEEAFVGTNWYKYAYAIAQRIQSGEIKTAEIFQKLQQYIALTNERIQRPSVSHPGLLDSFAAHGYEASVKPPNESDAGKVFIAVNVDDGAEDYPEKRLEICSLIKDFVAAGMVTMGTEEEEITLTNGQQFTFKFNLANPIPVWLRLTAVRSRNQLIAIPSDEEIRQKIFDYIKGYVDPDTGLIVPPRYRMGWDFEPERYYTLDDAPWANDVTLEWTDDEGENWYDDVYAAEYDDLFTFGLEDIEVIIT